jgi:hypothetical protein
MFSRISGVESSNAGSDLLVECLDQTPAFDPAEPDPIPEFEFDQSLPDDFESFRVSE